MKASTEVVEEAEMMICICCGKELGTGFWADGGISRIIDADYGSYQHDLKELTVTLCDDCITEKCNPRPSDFIEREIEKSNELQKEIAMKKELVSLRAELAELKSKLK